MSPPADSDVDSFALNVVLRLLYSICESETLFAVVLLNTDVSEREEGCSVVKTSLVYSCDRSAERLYARSACSRSVHAEDSVPIDSDAGWDWTSRSVPTVVSRTNVLRLSVLPKEEAVRTPLVPVDDRVVPRE